jgi:Mlc titration factor MtfA (ptsG expression regulator)
LPFLRRLRRRAALRKPFPEEWRSVVSARLAHWQYLDEAERERLEVLIRLFLVDHEFEAARGMELGDDVRLTIAAQACLLLVGLDRDGFRDVSSIIVYPSTVVRTGVFASPVLAGAVTDAPVPLLGEARPRGPVLIVWDQALAQARHPGRGHNVVFHEFAHKIDMADGSADGTPRMPDRASYRRWVEVCTRELDLVRRAAGAGEPTLLRDYAGTNPAEFFAVATEVFFDRPVAMEGERPDLYDVLREFYRQDPAARVRRAV